MGWCGMKVNRNPWIVVLLLVLSLTLSACGTELILTPSEQPPGGAELPNSADLDIIITPPAGQQPAGNDIIITPPAGGGSGGEDIIINIFPEEYLIFLGYLEAINARPAMADFGVIEGTVVSITPGEVCPYQEEVCPIEPYPNDWGIVRLDRVLSYSSTSSGEIEPIIEQPAEGKAGEGASTSGSQGQDIIPKEQVLSMLAEGQEVTAQFVLTARPVIIRHVPGGETDFADPAGNLEGGAEDTIEQPAQPREIAYKQLPKDGGTYIFTSQVGGVEEEVQNNLPGLGAGTRFRADIQYDGILYINEYEIIP